MHGRHGPPLPPPRGQSLIMRCPARLALPPRSAPRPPRLHRSAIGDPPARLLVRQNQLFLPVGTPCSRYMSLGRGTRNYYLPLPRGQIKSVSRTTVEKPIHFSAISIFAWATDRPRRASTSAGGACGCGGAGALQPSWGLPWPRRCSLTRVPRAHVRSGATVQVQCPRRCRSESSTGRVGVRTGNLVKQNAWPRHARLG